MSLLPWSNDLTASRFPSTKERKILQQRGIVRVSQSDVFNSNIVGAKEIELSVRVPGLLRLTKSFLKV